MSENSQTPEAPADAVEASQGTLQGDESPKSPANQSDASAAGESPSTASADAQSEGSEGADDEGGDEGEEAGAEGVAAEGGDPARKKRRRRRKKKGGKPGEAGAEAQGEGRPQGDRPQGEGRPHGKPQREGQGGVFARYFDQGHAGKRHAFAAGEVVAGRVVRASEGAFAVDLFGKATAFVDIFEPHEVPVLPDPPAPEAPAAAEGAPAEGAAEAAVEGAAEGAPSPATEAAAQSSEATVSSVEAVAIAPEVATDSAEAAGLSQPEAAAQGDTHSEDAHAAAAVEEHHDEAAQHDEGHHDEAPEEEPEAPPAPAFGTIFRGRIGSVAESGHVVLVNRIIDVAAAKKRIVDAREKRRRVRGVVFGFNRGGFDVLVEGIRVFCPASGMTLGPIENPEELLGQRLEFTVPPVKSGTHGLVVSRRGILERQHRKAAKNLFRSLQPGQRLKGRVTQIREFGIFVDLGGIEGLVHQSELSFSRGVRPQDAAAVGDEVEVQVLRVGEGQTRKERERVSLSMKALQADPWGSAADALEPGAVITGKVVRTTEFGAFIEIAPQVEGLLHISELGRELKHANQALQEGQELRVVVERVDRKARRISLSKLSGAEEKALESGADSKNARPPKPGAQITVVVDKIESAGLIVQIPGVFGRRGRGFIPNAEMGTERGTDHRKGFPPGTEIPAKVIGVDRDGGFRFSRKALLVDEERKSIQDYRREAARQGLGTFGDLLRKKLEGNKSP